MAWCKCTNRGKTRETAQSIKPQKTETECPPAAPAHVEVAARSGGSPEQARDGRNSRSCEVYCLSSAKMGDEMSGGYRYKRETALARAQVLVELLRPYCEQIEIAGSLRRCKETVGDIKIVA